MLANTNQGNPALRQGFFKPCNIQWYAGGVLIATNPERSFQRVARVGNLVTIHATLTGAAGVSQAGTFEIRNVPYRPALHYAKSAGNMASAVIFGYGEWTNQGTNFDSIRVFCSDATNWYFQFRLYNTYVALSATVTGNENDSITFTMLYETGEKE